MFAKSEAAGRQTHDERFRLLVESIDEYAIYMLDPGGHVVTWNRGAERNKGYSSWEVLGKHFCIFFTPEDIARDVPAQNLAEALSTGRFSGEGWRMRKNGERFWASVVLTAIRDGDGALLGFAKVTRDLTDLKRAQDAMQAMETALRAERDTLSAASESSLDSLYICDALRGPDGEIEDFVFTYLNSNVEKMVSIPRSAMLGSRMCSLFPSARENGLFELYRQVVLTGTPMVKEMLYADLWTSPFWVRVQAVKLRDGVAITASDVTAQHRIAEELADQHELLRVTLQSIGDAVLTTDARGEITWLNPVAERMTGWTTEEALGEPMDRVFHIVHGETREAAPNPLTICLAKREVSWLAPETVLISRNGNEYAIEDSAAPILDRDGHLRGAVLVFHDVTEQRRLSGEMSHRAAHDALTGLPNRAEFEARLRRTQTRAQEDGSENALLFIDLDQFKIVNDSCGHAVGDQLLRRVSGLMGQAVRSSDTLARLGGDEFGVILDHCPSSNALRVAQQICASLEDFRFAHEGQRFRVGASIGLVPVDDRWPSAAAVMQAADSCCYAAKEAGRNRVHVWHDSDERVRERHGEMQWISRIEESLDKDRFVLFAQRFQSLSEIAPRGLHLEALLRMVDLDGSLIPPGAFLPAAERFNLASRIDRWVLERAVQWIQSASPLEFAGCLNVNLSGQSVGDRAFHRWAIELLARAGDAACRRLCVEITETSAVSNLADAAVFIQQLHAVGVRVALDDFGAGASSFGYLKRMPVDFLKIDGQFVRDIVSDAFDEAAVRCFVDVAKVAKLQTVAEFVDDPQVLERLRAMGVDFAQGFLIHRPSPIGECLHGAGPISVSAALAPLRLETVS